MHLNEITRLVVQADVCGISAVLDWLKVMQLLFEQPLPILESREAVRQLRVRRFRRGKAMSYFRFDRSDISKMLPGTRRSGCVLVEV
jgi:hypothetical protein